MLYHTYRNLVLLSQRFLVRESNPHLPRLLVRLVTMVTWESIKFRLGVTCFLFFSSKTCVEPRGCRVLFMRILVPIFLTTRNQVENMLFSIKSPILCLRLWHLLSSMCTLSRSSQERGRTSDVEPISTRQTSQSEPLLGVCER